MDFHLKKKNSNMYDNHSFQNEKSLGLVQSGTNR